MIWSSKSKLNLRGIEGISPVTATGRATTAYISERSRNSKKLKNYDPPLKMKNKGGHSSTTFLNSCSFQRYRLLLPVQWLSPGKYLLDFWGSICSCLIKSILQLVILKSYSQDIVQVNFRYFPNHPNTSSI